MDTGSIISRRALLAGLLVAGNTRGGLAQSTARRRPSVRPFRIAIPQRTLDRILARVKSTRWPDRLEAAGWEYGVNWDYMRELVSYWTRTFDWRQAERELNRFPQFVADVEGYEIHFYHVRGRGSQVLPLVLTHGWPGSVVEFQQAIGPLTDPAAFGGSASDAFDVVIPSLPGFGFSSKPRDKPIGPNTIARLWHTLMTGVLGYSRFGAQGGDWGSPVTVQLARAFPHDVLGIHLNWARPRPAPPAEQSPEERAFLRSSSAFLSTGGDYASEHRNKPQTVGFALHDNPVGTAAWIVEKLKDWSDSGDRLDTAFTKDQVLTNVMWYLVTDTPATSVWIYRGATEDQADGGPNSARGKVSVPTGFAAFPKEPFGAPPRDMLAREFNLVHYSTMPRGGHFACFEQPQLFVDDVRAFFRPLRT